MFLGNGLQVALLEQGGHARRPATLSHPVLLGLWIPFQIYQTVAFLKRLCFFFTRAFPPSLHCLPAAEGGGGHTQLWKARSWQEGGAPISKRESFELPTAMAFASLATEIIPLR